MTNNDELNLNNQTNQNVVGSPLKRTRFIISFAYLIIQVLIPGLILYFLTSNDFTFSFHLPLWLMFVLSFALILFAIIVTLITYKCKLHQLDQFTYVVPFVFLIVGLYLSSYWLAGDYFLVRFIIGFVLAIIGIFIASLVLLLVVKKKNLKDKM
ncbi:MAG: hypothetical protein REH79_03155 [Spiroplasma sp.]|nr:hypothetical protein [Spiroplasma sp.]